MQPTQRRRDHEHAPREGPYPAAGLPLTLGSKVIGTVQEPVHSVPWDQGRFVPSRAFCGYRWMFERERYLASLVDDSGGMERWLEALGAIEELGVKIAGQRVRGFKVFEDGRCQWRVR